MTRAAHPTPAGVGALVAVVVAATLTLAIASPGRAFAEDEEEGRRQFKRGEDFLKAGDFRAAVEAFEAGYAAAPRVGFLLNIGNCYRKLGELGRARQHYWRFLDAAPKDHASRPEVLEYLQAIEQIEADGVAVDGPPGGGQAANGGGPLRPVTVTGGPAYVASAGGRAKAAVDPASAAAASVAAEPAGRPAPSPDGAGGSVFRRWWFWAVVGAAVAAGAGIFVYNQRGGAGCPASLGCARE
jgi:tetratricopeptide (TPR) repeat protein